MSFKNTFLVKMQRLFKMNIHIRKTNVRFKHKRDMEIACDF